MLKKRSILFLVVVLMITGLPMYSFANEVRTMPAEPIMEEKLPVSEDLPKANISRDEALKIAKETLQDIFSLSVDDPKFQYNIENRRDWSNPELYVWQMNWNYNDAAEYLYAHVTLDAMTGKVLAVSKDETTYGEPRKQTNLTKDEAQKMAQEFAEKMVPGLLKQTVLRDNGDDYYRIMQGGGQPLYYNFNFIRLYDGVKYENNYINVSIDGATGEIKSFNYRWDDLKNLPSKSEVITIEKATEIFKNNIKMELIYLPIRDQYKYEPVPKRVRLAYRANYNDYNILDAKTGKIVDWSGRPKEDGMRTASLTDRQIKEILTKVEATVKKDVTKERAEELAHLILAEHIGDPVTINNITYIEGDSYWEAAGKKAWNIDFTVEKKVEKKDGEVKETIMPQQNGRIMIDALSEELLAFNYWDYYGPYNEEFEPVMSWEEAYTKAIDLIAKYHPGKIDEIKTDQIIYINRDAKSEKEIQPMEYHFNFVRKINGVLYEENSINISFNNRTGKVQNFSCRWQDEINFPTAVGALSDTKVKDILLQYNVVELVYNLYNSTNDYQNPKYETMLVYRLNPKNPQFSVNMLLDGNTGKPIDYNGNEIPVYDLKEFESSIKGHWVERSARLLAQQGILDPSVFKPEEAITKIDAVKMLVKARGMDYYYPMERAEDNSKTEFSDVDESSDDYRYIQTAIRHGIIDNKEGSFNGSKVLTREELAVLMVKTLKYEDLAKATSIFTLDYTDEKAVSETLKGYVAICKGLELFSSEDNFRPKDSATMAETANMVYKSLTFMNR